MLFDRVRKRIQLTEAGRFFLVKAKQLLCDAESGVQQVREQFGGVRCTLRLGFIGPFLDDLVAPAVREFQQRHPNPVPHAGCMFLPLASPVIVTQLLLVLPKQPPTLELASLIALISEHAAGLGDA